MTSLMMGALFGIDIWFYQLLYSIMQSILSLCDTVYEVVLTLCGMKKNTVSGDGLLESLSKDSTIQMVFKWVIILGICVLGVVICIAVIRAVLSRKLDDPIKAQKNVATRTISSIVVMVLIPVFFFTLISLVGDITQYVLNSMNVSTTTGQVQQGGTSDSIAQEIFETATGTTDILYTTSASDFMMQADISPSSVNYIIGIIGGAIVLVAMFMMGFKLAERIFMLLFYYIISPIVLAISPLDDGNRFAVWRDSVIAKLLASGGIIICISLFLVSMPVIKSFGIDVFGNTATAQIFNLLFIISGSFFASRGGEIIANLVGDNIGANEGRETADSLRKATAGVKVGATTVAGGVGLGMATLIGTRASRRSGVSNQSGEKYNSTDNSSKATKTSKLASLGAFNSDHYNNIRRYGLIGGTYQNARNDISNASKARKARAENKANNNDAKAKK